MKGKNASLILLCLVTLLLASCRIAPVYNVTDSNINTGSGKEPTLEQVQQAILSAGTVPRPAWTMKVVKPGHILATLSIRSHVAMADIMFNTKSYSINYNGSTNLKYDPAEKTIHSNYNGWIQNLDAAIKGKFAEL